MAEIIQDNALSVIISWAFGSPIKGTCPLTHPNYFSVCLGLGLGLGLGLIQ